MQMSFGQKLIFFSGIVLIASTFSAAAIAWVFQGDAIWAEKLIAGLAGCFGL